MVRRPAHRHPIVSQNSLDRREVVAIGWHGHRMMNRNSHLVLHEVSVPAATEWSVDLPGWLFLRVAQGEGYAFREKTPFLMNEGDALVNAPGRPCQLRASQLGKLSVQFFQVSPELLAGTISASERQHLERIAQVAHTFPEHRSAASPVAQQFAALSQTTRPSHTLLTRCELLHLSSMILTDHLPPPASQSNPTATAASPALTAKQRFEALVTEMVESQWQHQTPDKLARQCGCGVRHFSRLFRSHFGQSLIPKRITLCLHKAKQLLEESDAKIIDVAMDSGFNHVGLFTARFKRRFGCTPSEWRRRKGLLAKTDSPRTGRNTSTLARSRVST